VRAKFDGRRRDLPAGAVGTEVWIGDIAAMAEWKTKIQPRPDPVAAAALVPKITKTDSNQVVQRSICFPPVGLLTK
jgi:hypothetical protein